VQKQLFQERRVFDATSGKNRTRELISLTTTPSSHNDRKIFAKNQSRNYGEQKKRTIETVDGILVENAAVRVQTFATSDVASYGMKHHCIPIAAQISK